MVTTLQWATWRCGTTETELASHFAAISEVISAKTARFEMTGTSRGYGLIKVHDEVVRRAADELTARCSTGDPSPSTRSKPDPTRANRQA